MNVRVASISVLLSAILVPACLQAGCDIDLDFDFTCDVGDDCLCWMDDFGYSVFCGIESTYAQGARINFTITRDQFIGSPGWYLESEDESILSIESVSGGPREKVFSCLAKGIGETKLVLRNQNGSIRSTETVRVVRPDRISLSPEPCLESSLEGYRQYMIQNLKPEVVMIGYYHGEEELAGVGILDTRTEGARVALETEFMETYPPKELLKITPEELGRSIIYLSSSNQILDVLVVDSVDAEAINKVSQLEWPSALGGNGESCILAIALSQNECRIAGTEFSWELNGVLQEGVGDAFCYRSGDASTLRATAGSYSVEGQYNISEGYVTNYVESYSCGHAQGSQLLTLLLLLPVLIGLRRHSKNNDQV